MKVACNFDNTDSILSSVVQILPPPSGTPSINRRESCFAPLGLRSVGIVKAEGFDNTNSIKSQAVQQNVVPCGVR